MVLVLGGIISKNIDTTLSSRKSSFVKNKKYIVSIVFILTVLNTLYTQLSNSCSIQNKIVFPAMILYCRGSWYQTINDVIIKLPRYNQHENCLTGIAIKALLVTPTPKRKDNCDDNYVDRGRDDLDGHFQDVNFR